MNAQQEVLSNWTSAQNEKTGSASLAPSKFSTYSSFPTKLYERFVNLYVQPFTKPFQNGIDLGCGSGGLVGVLDEQFGCNLLGVDVSELSIERCRQNPDLDKKNIS